MPKPRMRRRDIQTIKKEKKKRGQETAYRRRLEELGYMQQAKDSSKILEVVCMVDDNECAELDV